jgi:hypothetical protein
MELELTLIRFKTGIKMLGIPEISIIVGMIFMAALIYSVVRKLARR